MSINLHCMTFDGLVVEAHLGDLGFWQWTRCRFRWVRVVAAHHRREGCLHLLPRHWLFARLVDDRHQVRFAVEAFLVIDLLVKEPGQAQHPGEVGGAVDRPALGLRLAADRPLHAAQQRRRGLALVLLVGEFFVRDRKRAQA